MRKDLLGNAATAVLVLCALTVTGLVVRRELFPPAAAAPPGADAPRSLSASEWAAASGAGEVMGPAGAPVQIVEFSDFQCPFCARIAPVLQRVRERHPGRVAVIYRHYPLEQIHPFARDAAVASECAAAEGRFEPFLTLVFAEQDSLGTKAWERFAAQAGVRDADAFRRCLSDAAVRRRVERDAEVARRLQVRATPTLVINGTLITGILTDQELEQYVFRAAR
ncbi:MAG: DsbA family protein [Longimicrobiaceae bacterium]